MSYDFHNKREVTARKEHRCSEAGNGCNRKILPGTRYVRISGKFDGEMYDEAQCLRCDRLFGKARKRYGQDFDWDEGIEFGGLREFIREARRW